MLQLLIDRLSMYFRAVGSYFKLDVPIVESKPQMKQFTAVTLDFAQNRLGQAHPVHTITTALYLESTKLEILYDYNTNFFTDEKSS